MSGSVNSVSVGATSTEIIAPNSGLSKATVQWISGSDVNLAFGCAAENAKGITLGSTGILIYEVPVEYLRAGVYGIVASATGTVQTSQI